MSVCAVCGWPVAGSFISSQLPWSAVMKTAPPFARAASTILPTPDVDGLDRVDRRVEHAGVPDHVGVGEVHEDEVELAAARSRLATASATPPRRHLRLLVVGRDVLRRREHLPLFAGERLLAPAVEEVRHVRVLLGLGAAKLRQPGARDDLGEDVRDTSPSGTRSAGRTTPSYVVMQA